MEQLLRGAKARFCDGSSFSHRSDRRGTGLAHLERQAPVGDDLLEKQTNRDTELQPRIRQDLYGFILQLGLQSQAHIGSLRSSICHVHGGPVPTM